MMKNSIPLALAAIALLTTRAFADNISRYQDILEWYEEQPLGKSPFSEKSRQQALLTVFKGTTTSAIAQTGTTVVVPNISTELSGNVSGDDPGCGDGKVSDSSAIGDAFTKGGAVMAVVAIGTGGAGAAALAGIGAVMALAGLSLGDGKATTANCGVATLVLSGHYTEAQVKTMLSASFQNKSGEEFRPANFDRPLDWARIGAPLVQQAQWKIDPKSNFANTLAILHSGDLEVPIEKPSTCPVTMIGVRVKNWSHNRTRSFYVSADTNKLEVPEGACLDATFLNKRVYGAQYVRALGPEVFSEYEKWVAKGLGNIKD